MCLNAVASNLSQQNPQFRRPLVASAPIQMTSSNLNPSVPRGPTPTAAATSRIPGTLDLSSQILTRRSNQPPWANLNMGLPSPKHSQLNHTDPILSLARHNQHLVFTTLLHESVQPARYTGIRSFSNWKSLAICES